jgi:phosphodiesterase/alkaline phosphatase D-like protein
VHVSQRAHGAPEADQPGVRGSGGRVNAEIAQYVQWDDHEVTNNWFPERILEDGRYTEKRVALLAARAKRAMFEFTPRRPNPIESERVYRLVGRGPLLDLFPLGRELEIADLLRFIKHNEIRHVVWITADVHYCATRLYDPARAQFTDFARSTSSSRARSTPVASVPMHSTTRSAPKSSSRAIPAAG